MRLREFTHGPTNTPESNLITALELLRNRYKDSDTPPSIKTQSLINLVLNTDHTFDYQALVSANENNPAVKNLIKSFNKDTVELQPIGDEGSNTDAETDTSAGMNTGAETDETTTNLPDINGDANSFQAPVMSVDDMAKRAAKNRGAPVAQ